MGGAKAISSAAAKLAPQFRWSVGAAVPLSVGAAILLSVGAAVPSSVGAPAPTGPTGWKGPG